MAAAEHGNGVNVGCWSGLLRSKGVGLWRKVKKTGADDPRRVFHAFKVGLALVLVSICYYVNPLYHGLEQSAIWAVITVVLVMEFTVGAVVMKGLNRACGTLLAGVLGAGAHYLATFLIGEKWEPVALGLVVFLVAAVATFARFIPEVKSRYDYGVMMFILTFCMVAVSSYRQEVVLLSKARLFTVATGVAVSFFTSILVFPVWAGDDVHKLAAGNVEKLGSFLQGFGEALQGTKPLSQHHKSVLNSKAAEDSLSSLARWEPPHGHFGFRHPWDQYLKIGDLSRRCAYHMETLNVCLGSSQVEFDKKFTDACLELSTESGKALSELALAFRSMTMPPAAIKHHMVAAGAASEQLMSLLDDCTDLKEVLHVASIASILTEVIECAQEIVASVEELARLAHFRSTEVKKAAVTPVTDDQSSDHAIIQVD